MAPRLRRHYTAIAAATAVVLAVPVLSACGAVDTALDCARTASAISSSVADLQQAASDAADNPLEAQQALDRIDKNLDKLGDQTDNGDLGKAVDDMGKGVDSARNAIEQGKSPDITPITDAAAEVTKTCSPE
ncbi:hypothetical protein AB0C51_06330 [Streptomyces pathocidini]|uniref:Secreted protein n=1 Tax=Streptomyces pathocidini TaxID=1650571 RepID=A0ABW7UW51_9ACTN|nr:hypothetical protein [Streptomyces pathocidini]